MDIGFLSFLHEIWVGKHCCKTPRGDIWTVVYCEFQAKLLIGIVEIPHSSFLNLSTKSRASRPMISIRLQVVKLKATLSKETKPTE